MTTFFNDRIGTKSPCLIVALQTGTQPNLYPFLGLSAITKAHYLCITEDLIDWLTIQNMEMPQEQSFSCQCEHVKLMHHLSVRYPLSLSLEPLFFQGPWFCERSPSEPHTPAVDATQSIYFPRYQ